MNIDFYREHGYWIERKLLTHYACDVLIEEAKRFENYTSGSYRPQMMPHRGSDKFLYAFKIPGLLMHAAVSGKPVGLQTEFFYCKPGTKGFALHQDNFFVEAPEGSFASAWIALTDITPEKCGLVIYPGSHKAGLFPVQVLEHEDVIGQAPNANKTKCIIPHHYQPFNVTVAKGDAVIFDGHLVHGSHKNSTEDWRYVLLCTYIRKGEPFRAGKYAQREAVEL